MSSMQCVFLINTVFFKKTPTSQPSTINHQHIQHNNVLKLFHCLCSDAPIFSANVPLYRSINIIILSRHRGSKFWVRTVTIACSNSDCIRGKSSSLELSICFFKASNLANNLCNTNTVLARFFLVRSANFHLHHDEETTIRKGTKQHNTPEHQNTRLHREKKYPTKNK